VQQYVLRSQGHKRYWLEVRREGTPVLPCVVCFILVTVRKHVTCMICNKKDK
jgi:hypothetical protein